jgi:hypothetical protein
MLVLLVIDTKLVAPLTAIVGPCRHLARKHQLYGANVKEMAQVDMLIDGVEVSRGVPLAVCNGVRRARVDHSLCSRMRSRAPGFGGVGYFKKYVCHLL